MEITIKTRVLLFGQYAFQKFRFEGSVGTYRELNGINWKWMAEDEKGESFRIDKCKLILKPLSSITDEDAIEVAKIMSFKANLKQNGLAFINEALIKQEVTVFKFHPMSGIIVSQFLQSKGYDLPHYLLNGKTLHECNLCIYE